MGLILASASPRRQELLRLITNDFTVFPAAVDESLPPALSVDNAAQYLARKKAAAVSSAFPDDIVLGSDTRSYHSWKTRDAGTGRRNDAAVIRENAHSNYWSGACQRKRNAFVPNQYRCDILSFDRKANTGLYRYK